jgi:hypothetical protein
MPSLPAAAAPSAKQQQCNATAIMQQQNKLSKKSYLLPVFLPVGAKCVCIGGREKVVFCIEEYGCHLFT